MVGRRIPDGTWHDESHGEWEVGDYCLDADKRHIWVQLPYKDDGAPVHLPLAPITGGWTLTENEDGTLSLQPSIHAHGVWHGFLTNGELSGNPVTD